MKYLLTLVVIALMTLSTTTQTAESLQSSTAKKVVSVHLLELKDNVNPNEFEEYINEVVVPICDKIKGMEFILAKGDRGSRIDKYAVILIFDSLEERNRIYPYGEESPEDWGDNKIWEKFEAMASGLGDVSLFSDYVEVSK